MDFMGIILGLYLHLFDDNLDGHLTGYWELFKNDVAF